MRLANETSSTFGRRMIVNVVARERVLMSIHACNGMNNNKNIYQLFYIR